MQPPVNRVAKNAASDDEKSQIFQNNGFNVKPMKFNYKIVPLTGNKEDSET